MIGMDVCPTCSGRAKLVKEFLETTMGRYTADVEQEFYRCERCGEEYMAAEAINKSLDYAAEVIRQKYGLISPGRIKRLRLGYGLSQAQFEKLLNAGPKTVVRWEKESIIPTGPTNMLLEILEGSPVEMKKLAARRGVTLRKRPAEARPAAREPRRRKAQG